MRNAYALKFLIEFVSGIFWTANVSSLMKTGHTLADSALIMAGYYFAIAVFEVPTGMIADRYGRRKSVIAGLGLVSSGFLGLYAGFSIVSAGLAGIGFTLISGAFTAWIYNLAEATSKIFDPTDFFLKFDIFGRLAMIAGAFSGAITLKLSPASLWLLLSLASFAALALALKTPPGSTDLATKNSHREISGVSKLATNTPLLLLLLSVLFFGFEQGIRNTIYQPFVLSLRGGNEMFLAYWQAGLAFARLAGLLFYRHLLKEKFKGYGLAAIALLGLAVTEFIAGFSTNFWLIWGLWLSAVFAIGWFFPLKDALLNSLASERNRATVISLDSMLFQLGSAVTCLMLWATLGESTFQTYWVIASLLLSISVGLFYFVGVKPVLGRH